MIHLRFEGRSFDLNEHLLNIHRDLDDHAIFEALARHLQVEPTRFTHYVIDRPPGQHDDTLIVRPEAVYG